MRTRTLWTLAAGAVLLAACGGGGTTTDPTASPSPTEVSTSSEPPSSPDPSGEPTPTEQTEPPFTANTDPDESEGSGMPVVVTDIRIDAYGTYDRVVITTTSEGSAGWMAEYVTQAQAQGSGDVVEVDGEATLQVLVTNVTYPTENGSDGYQGDDRITSEDTKAIQEVVVGNVFEGQFELWIGTVDELPFRVVEGDEPNTVYVDIVHPDNG